MDKKYIDTVKKIGDYPNLTNNKGDLFKAVIDYSLIKAPYPLGDLEQKYRSMEVKPSNFHKNILRHYYTNAKLIQKYPENFLRDLGSFKEDADRIDSKPLEDTQEDFRNNERGINLGKKYPYAPSDFLFDQIREDIGLPLSPRNNKLFGYILKAITPEEQE